MTAPIRALGVDRPAPRPAQGTHHVTGSHSRVAGDQPPVTPAWYPATPGGAFPQTAELRSLQEQLDGSPAVPGARPAGPALHRGYDAIGRRSLAALARINAKTQAALQLAGRSDLGPDNP